MLHVNFCMKHRNSCKSCLSTCFSGKFSRQHQKTTLRDFYFVFRRLDFTNVRMPWTFDIPHYNCFTEKKNAIFLLRDISFSHRKSFEFSISELFDKSCFHKPNFSKKQMQCMCKVRNLSIFSQRWYFWCFQLNEISCYHRVSYNFDFTLKNWGLQVF